MSDKCAHIEVVPLPRYAQTDPKFVVSGLCELGDGFVEYIYSHVLQKIEVVNSKLRMDDVIDLIFSRNDFAYQFKVYPDWIRMARGNLSRCKITYQFNRAAPETVYFNDEFDAQEWLISNLDTKKWFK